MKAELSTRNDARSASPTKAPAGSVRWSREEQDYVFTTPARASGSAHPPSRPPAYAADAYEDPTFSQYVFDAPRHIADLGPGFVYQHTRTLRGIKSTHSAPVGEMVQTPSCGPATDMFLQALGFDVESKLTIALTLQRSESITDFVRMMCGHGLPALEAKYIWYLYSSDPPRASWASTHIM